MKKKKFQKGNHHSANDARIAVPSWPTGEERSLRSRNTRAHEIRRTRKERDLRDLRAHARHGEPSPVELDPRQILRRVTTFYRGVLPVIFPALASFRRFETVTRHRTAPRRVTATEAACTPPRLSRDTLKAYARDAIRGGNPQDPLTLTAD